MTVLARHWYDLQHNSHSDIGFQLIDSQVEERRGNSMAKGPRNCRCFNKGVSHLTAEALSNGGKLRRETCLGEVS